MRRKTIYYSLLVVFAALYYILILTGLTNGDYLIYSYKFSPVPVEGFPWPVLHEKIASFHDVIASQYAHYLSMNGRALLHTVVQVFSSFLRYDVCCLIATLVFVLTLLLGEKVCLKRAATSGLPAFVLVVAVFAFCSVPSAIYNMITTINYLWPVTLCLLFLFLLKHDGSIWSKALFLPVALMAGWSHEAISVPVAAALVFYLILEKRLKPYQITGIVLFLLGTAAVLFAPGNFTKFQTSHDAVGPMLFVKIHFSMIKFLRVFYVLVAALIILAAKRRLKPILQRYRYWFIALAASLFFVFLTGAINPRSTFFIDIIAGGILCMLADEYLTTKWHKVLITAFAANIIPLYAAAPYYRHQIKQSFRQAESTIASWQYPVIYINLERTHVPPILHPYAGNGQIGHIIWVDIVYQFVYHKNRVRINFIEAPDAASDKE